MHHKIPSAVVRAMYLARTVENVSPMILAERFGVNVSTVRNVTRRVRLGMHPEVKPITFDRPEPERRPALCPAFGIKAVKRRVMNRNVASSYSGSAQTFVDVSVPYLRCLDR